MASFRCDSMETVLEEQKYYIYTNYYLTTNSTVYFESKHDDSFDFVEFSATGKYLLFCPGVVTEKVINSSK